jgi:hypothetical protein
MVVPAPVGQSADLQSPPPKPPQAAFHAGLTESSIRTPERALYLGRAACHRPATVVSDARPPPEAGRGHRPRRGAATARGGARLRRFTGIGTILHRGGRRRVFPCDSSRPIERRITVVTNAGWPFAAAPIGTGFFGGRRSRCRAVSRHIGTVGVFAISVNHPVPRCLDLAFLAPAHPCADIGQPPIVTSVVTEFDRHREGDFWIPLPAPKRHVGCGDDHSQLPTVDVPVLRRGVDSEGCHFGWGAAGHFLRTRSDAICEHCEDAGGYRAFFLAVAR